MQHLYTEAFEHWNEELWKFAQKNTLLHGRSGIYSVHYEGRRYFPIQINHLDDEQTPFCLIVHPEHPELMEEMGLIADRFDQLEKERYAVSRFVGGLLKLGINHDQFERILGDHLKEACNASLLDQVLDCSGKQLLGQQESIRTYVQQNQDIVDMIGERRLINLIVGK